MTHPRVGGVPRDILCLGPPIGGDSGNYSESSSAVADDPPTSGWGTEGYFVPGSAEGGKNAFIKLTSYFHPLSRMTHPRKNLGTPGTCAWVRRRRKKCFYKIDFLFSSAVADDPPTKKSSVPQALVPGSADRRRFRQLFRKLIRCRE